MQYIIGLTDKNVWLYWDIAILFMWLHKIPSLWDYAYNLRTAMNGSSLGTEKESQRAKLKGSQYRKFFSCSKGQDTFSGSLQAFLAFWCFTNPVSKVGDRDWTTDNPILRLNSQPCTVPLGYGNPRCQVKRYTLEIRGNKLVM